MKLSKSLFEERSSLVLAGIAVMFFLVVVAAVVKGLSHDDRGALAQEKSQEDTSSSEEASRGPRDTLAHASSVSQEQRRHGAMTRTPGDFLSDILTALEEGESSHQVHLESEEMQEVFSRWSDEARTKGRGKGLTLLLLEKDKNGAERYRIVMEDTGICGVITVKEMEGLWHVIEVGNSGTKQPEQDEALRLFKAARRDE